MYEQLQSQQQYGMNKTHNNRGSVEKAKHDCQSAENNCINSCTKSISHNTYDANMKSAHSQHCAYTELSSKTLSGKNLALTRINNPGEPKVLNFTAHITTALAY